MRARLYRRPVLADSAAADAGNRPGTGTVPTGTPRFAQVSAFEDEHVRITTGKRAVLPGRDPSNIARVSGALRGRPAAGRISMPAGEGGVRARRVDELRGGHTVIVRKGGAQMPQPAMHPFGGVAPSRWRRRPPSPFDAASSNTGGCADG